MSKQDFHAFTHTTKEGGLFSAIITPGFSSPPHHRSEMKGIKPTPTSQLWDTGATNCAITSSLVKKLKLTPIGKTEVTYGGGTEETYVHLIHVFLPNNVIIPNIQVTECDDGKGDFDMIIGMDVITEGDFSVTNVNGNTVVSFRTPSTEKIDYVKEANIIKSLASRKAFTGRKGQKYTHPKKKRKKRRR
ncbi:MAG: aspartyl protease family protein [Bacteroidetes bacterium]|nr:aspartyl protease family protein [Bacteroidota bacterium]